MSEVFVNISFTWEGKVEYYLYLLIQAEIIRCMNFIPSGVGLVESRVEQSELWQRRETIKLIL